MMNGDSGEIFNICSGKVRTIRELIEKLIEISGEDVEIRKDPQRMRAYDQPLLMGSPEKLMTVTGWKPMIAIEDTLSDVYREIAIRLHKEAQAGL